MTPRNILIVPFDGFGIGNAILLTPALVALLERCPADNIFVFGQGAPMDVLAGLGLTIIDSYKNTPTFDVAFEMNTRRPDSLPYRAKDVCVLEYEPPYLRHETTRYMEIPKWFGFSGDMPAPRCATEAVPLPWDRSQKVVFLSDTAANRTFWARKSWPFFKEAAWVLHDAGLTIAVIGSKDEALRFNPEGWPPHHNLLGKYSIAQLAYCLQHGAFFIGNDSGPTHISAAVGTKTFVLFGATSWIKSRPLGKNVAIVRKSLPCQPCQGTKRWDTCSSWWCINKLSVRNVMSEIRKDDCVASWIGEAKEDPGTQRFDFSRMMLFFDMALWAFFWVVPYAAANCLRKSTNAVKKAIDFLQY